MGIVAPEGQLPRPPRRVGPSTARPIPHPHRHRRRDPDARECPPPRRHLSPARPHPRPRPSLPHPLQPHRIADRPSGAHRRPARLRRGARGRARPLRVRRHVRALPAGGRGWVRHDRVGREAALVERGGGHVRVVVSGRGTVARRDGAAAVAPGDCARDDVLDARDELASPATDSRASSSS
jgi:hypothetical protein